MGSSLRWYCKKAARRALALTAWGSGWLALRRILERGPSVRVLMYHRVRDARRDPFTVSPREFREQMEWIASRRLAVSLDELRDFLSGGKALRRGSVLVTIDDGYRDLWTEALPTLQRLGIPAVAFVTVDEVASDRSGDARERLSWAEVAALPGRGIAVGSHSWSHRSLAALEPEQVRFHARESRLQLERRLGRAVTSFAYPFGTRADFSAMTRRVLREEGYDCAFTAQHGAVAAGADPHALPRVKVEGGDGMWTFKLLVAGAMDPWRWIDRFLWRVQQSELRAPELSQGA